MSTVASRRSSQIHHADTTAAPDYIHTAKLSEDNFESAVSFTDQPSINNYPEALSRHETQTPSPSAYTQELLTPEDSFEHPYSIPSRTQTTSSLDDLLWEQNINVPEDADVDLFSAPETNGIVHREFNSHPILRGTLSPDQKPTLVTTIAPSLLSPQLTNNSSPTEPVAISTRAETHTMYNNNLIRSTSGVKKGKLETPAHSGNVRNADAQPDPLEPIARTLSPVVVVSRPEHAAAYVPQNFPRARSSSKRSYTPRSSSDLSPHDPQPAHGDNGQYEAQQDSDDADRSFGRTGLEPGLRGDDIVPSLKEIEEKQHLEEKKAEVETWLATSEAGDVEADQPKRNSLNKRRGRALSADPRHANIIAMSTIPGPGVLLDEESGEDFSDSASEASAGIPSPPAIVDTTAPAVDEGYFPETDPTPPEEEEPLPQQFFRARPWQDAANGAAPRDTTNQPPTSNAAIVKYDQQVAKFETASRSATWGTRRRLSDTDVNSIIGDRSKLSDLSIADRKSRERGSSFIKRARGLIPNRSASHNKKIGSDTVRAEPPTQAPPKKRGESLGSIKAVQRVASFGKQSKSPTLDTGSALMAMTGQLAAVGRGNSATSPPGGLSPGPWHALKRPRSRSELPKSPSKGKPGLAELMSLHGGPPMPTLASPMQVRSIIQEKFNIADNDDYEDDEIDDIGVKMDMSIRIEDFLPTFEGFRTNANQLNPRLEPFLLQRISQEQVRRYKKLVESKIKHSQAVGNQRCSSGTFCFELGGQATPLPPRTSAKDPESTYAQFQVSANGDSDNEGAAFAEGAVTAAQFPSGIPLPPTKWLPAEFECPLCFKVKRFQKPSDWTKHVHEDVQPFTCTFARCTEPKSFKRKADWVRHENERHRHLEWWKCSITDCNHVCYRKDNFVQHLVREHKKTEPKGKNRGNVNSKLKQGLPEPKEGGEIDDLWRLVDSCRFDTQDKPRNEACKFCGNVCSSWKKLTVHLAKHMEQIAMPVLALVSQRNLGPDTIISPVDQMQSQSSFVAVSPMTKSESSNLSPYTMHAVPQYQGSSASHSPVKSDAYYYTTPQAQERAQQYDEQSLHPQTQMPSVGMAEFARMHGLPANLSYGPYQQVNRAGPYVTATNGGPVTYPPVSMGPRRAPLQMSPQIPRSHPAQSRPYGTQVNNLQTTFDQPEPVCASPVNSVHYGVPYQAGSNENHAVDQAQFDPYHTTDGNLGLGVSQPQMYNGQMYNNMHSQAGGPSMYPYQQ